jgi:tellurite resistance protein
MDLSFISSGTANFDARMYIRILIAIAKADPDNGAPEFEFVRRQAKHLDLDYDHYLADTDKSFSIDRQKVSRTTALTILKDAILLASLDGNFSLPEKQRIYTYAEKLDISRRDVDDMESMIEDYRRLDQRWRQLVLNR